jgi:RNA polymerase sigma factor (sigma-70 family)
MIPMGNTATLTAPTTHRTRRALHTIDQADDMSGPLSMDQLIAQYGRLVASAARRVVGPGGDIDDVMQETWITYLRSGHQVRDRRCLGGWLYQVANRIALRSVGRGPRTISFDDLAESAECATDTIDIDDEVLRLQQRQAIGEVSTTLRPRDRELLELFLDDADHGYTEISRRSGVPVGSLGPTRERLIRKLRAVPALQRLADTGDMGDFNARSCAA